MGKTTNLNWWSPDFFHQTVSIAFWSWISETLTGDLSIIQPQASPGCFSPRPLVTLVRKHVPKYGPKPAVYSRDFRISLQKPFGKEPSKLIHHQCKPCSHWKICLYPFQFPPFSRKISENCRCFCCVCHPGIPNFPSFNSEDFLRWIEKQGHFSKRFHGLHLIARHVRSGGVCSAFRRLGRLLYEGGTKGDVWAMDN